jgi:hypothetical protein
MYALHFPCHVCFERYFRFHYSICECAPWYKDTMAKERYFVLFEFVPQVLLYLGKLEEQQELFYSTNSSIIVS